MILAGFCPFFFFWYHPHTPRACIIFFPVAFSFLFSSAFCPFSGSGGRWVDLGQVRGLGSLAAGFSEKGVLSRQALGREAVAIACWDFFFGISLLVVTFAWRMVQNKGWEVGGGRGGMEVGVRIPQCVERWERKSV